jgi:hypothetical protein
MKVVSIELFARRCLRRSRASVAIASQQAGVTNGRYPGRWLPCGQGRPGRRVAGITLLEVLLALGLTVLATGLIGGLIQIYQGQLELAKDNVRQARLARSLLTMIADDVRGVLREYQNQDAQTLESFLAASAGGNAGQAGGGGGQGQGGGGGGAAMAALSAAPGALSGGQGTGGGANAAASAGTGDEGLAADGTMLPTTLPPGIYGTETSIEIDVSRPPRPDQYIGELANPLESRIVDIPSDTKKVSYFVQSPQLVYGVQDPLNQAVGGAPQRNAGLVRRSLDRAVNRWAMEQVQTMQLSSTGEILAPEVIALSFSYFDGLQWLPSWDSSLQGLPWAVQITIAMQHARFAREAPLVPGSLLQDLLLLPKTDTGVETYSMLAIIPGVQLLKTPAEQMGTTGAMESPTSSLGF